MGTKIKKKCEPFQANSTLSTGNSRIRFAFLLSSHFFRNFAFNLKLEITKDTHDKKTIYNSIIAVSNSYTRTWPADFVYRGDEELVLCL